MPATKHFLAIDLGASSGRVMDAGFDGRVFQLREVHRFTNGMIRVPDGSEEGRYCWDLIGLWQQIVVGLRRALAECPGEVVSIGVDSWGVDYALLGPSGRLLGMATAYRDPRNQRSFESVLQRISRERIYRATGIQFLPFNSIYQLAADAQDPDRPLERTRSLLMIADVFHYWLSGVICGEQTNASTTQLYDARACDWVESLCTTLKIPRGILPEVKPAGTRLGPLGSVVQDELGGSRAIDVVAPATHDTGSAVAGTPLLERDREAFLSSGTWSLLGVERGHDCRTQEALQANFTNEAGVAGTTRFLTNAAGMWLVQECQRQWERDGRSFGASQLVMMAEAAPPLESLIDPDDPSFMAPGDMPARIRDYCRQTQQQVPGEEGAVLRCIFDSLAIRYGRILARIEQITQQSIDTVRIVGGGAHNELLNRLTAAATQKRVTAGPAEATALGNALVQAVAAGLFRDLDEARQVIVPSFPLREFGPDDDGLEPSQWESAGQRWDALRLGTS